MSIEDKAHYQWLKPLTNPLNRIQEYFRLSQNFSSVLHSNWSFWFKKDQLENLWKVGHLLAFNPPTSTSFASSRHDHTDSFTPQKTCHSLRYVQYISIHQMYSPLKTYPGHQTVGWDLPPQLEERSVVSWGDSWRRRVNGYRMLEIVKMADDKSGKVGAT